MANAFQREVRSVLLPLWRWLFVIVIFLVTAIVVTKKWVGYMKPLYRSKATIQIDNRDNGIDMFQNFSESAVPIKSASTGFTEMEQIQSRELIGKALDTLHWNASYQRIGSIKTTELYLNSPFFIRFSGPDSLISHQSLMFEYIAEGVFNCKQAGEKQEALSFKVRFDKPFKVFGLEAVLVKNSAYLSQKPMALLVGDRFRANFKSREEMIDEILLYELFVKALDKDNTLLQVSYSNPNPEKARDFLTALLQSYISNTIDLRKRQAYETIRFLDTKIEEASQKVSAAEAELAKFRDKSRMSDSKLELDAAFKERMQYNMHDVNYDLQRVEIKRIYDYLKSGKSLQDFAPNFEAFNDPVFKDAFLKMQALELQKQDLLVYYTERSKEVMNVQDKIVQLKSFLNESISNALGSLNEKQKQLNKTITETNQKINALPDQQYREAYHNRNLQLNEQIYSRLVEKQTSLSIAAAAISSYHRIIEAPDMPKGPYSPNKAILLGLAGFLALVLGMLVAHLLENFFSKARSEADLDALQLYPVLGKVNRLATGRNFSTQITEELLSELTLLLKKENKGTPYHLLTFCSAERGVGKTFLCEHIARIFAEAGNKVLVVDTHIRQDDIAKCFNIPQNHGVSGMIFHNIDPTLVIVPSDIRNLHLITAGQYYEGCTAPAISHALDNIITEVAPRYDLILVDTPSLLEQHDAIPLLSGEHQTNLFITRYKRSRIRAIKSVSNILLSKKITSVFYVLNFVPSKRGIGRLFEK